MGCGGGFAGSANEAAGKSAAMSMTPSNVSRVEIRRLIVLPLNRASWRDSIIVVSHYHRVQTPRTIPMQLSWRQRAASSRRSQKDDRGHEMRDRRASFSDACGRNV